MSEENMRHKIKEIREELVRRSSRVVEFVEKTLYRIENNLKTEFSYNIELRSLDLALDMSKDIKNEEEEFNEFIHYWLK